MKTLFLIPAVMLAAQTAMAQDARININLKNINLQKALTQKQIPQLQKVTVSTTKTKSISAANSQTAAAMGQDRGGGDLCEDRIKTIRDDIQVWIHQGGAKNLSLPGPLMYSQYESSMLNEISKAHIRCVGPGDAGYPVNINGTAKVCNFDKSQGFDQITCDFTKFQGMEQSDQYVLVHHEYAGLSRIEKPNGDDSKYDISNQISGNLVNEVIKKLAVKPSEPLPIKTGIYVTDGISACSLRIFDDSDDKTFRVRTEQLCNGKVTTYTGFRHQLGQPRYFSATDAARCQPRPNKPHPCGDNLYDKDGHLIPQIGNRVTTYAVFSPMNDQAFEIYTEQDYEASEYLILEDSHEDSAQIYYFQDQ